MKNSATQFLLHNRCFHAALAGLVLAAAFPNYNIAGLAWVAPALMLACADGKSPRESFRIGYVAGIAFWLPTLSWLLEIPVTGFPILGWIALSAFLAIYPATWVWLMAGQLRNENWSQRFRSSLLGAATWVALEMIRSRFLSGFPWDTIGSSQWQLTPLIQIASVTGVYGVSFLVVWVSLSLLSAVRAMIRNPTTRYVWISDMILPVLIVIGLFVNGMSRIRHATDATDSIRVTFIQPAVPQTMIWDSSENTNRFNQLLALTESALSNKTDLLLWPEAALPKLTDESFAAITNLIQRHGVWMMFNTDDVVEKANPTRDSRYDVFNAAYLFNPAGLFAATYHKRQLVIFGEYIPLVDALPFIKWFTPITGSYTSGRRINQFQMERQTLVRPDPTNETQRADSEIGVPSHIKAAPLICFEDTFPHHVRDHVDGETDFMVNLTNDGWFGEKASQWQHLASAAFRAVENGIPLLRCCNTGITCWVDEHGRMREILRDESGSEYAKGFVTWEIPISNHASRARTFYNQHGDWFGWSCVAVSGVLLFATVRRSKK